MSHIITFPDCLVRPTPLAMGKNIEIRLSGFNFNSLTSKKTKKTIQKKQKPRHSFLMFVDNTQNCITMRYDEQNSSSTVVDCVPLE